MSTRKKAYDLILAKLKKHKATLASSFSSLSCLNLDYLFKILKIIFVRSILAIILSLLTSFYICVTNGKYIYLFFILPILLIILETIYICMFRQGRDFSWFSISALAYISVLISVIWKQGIYKYKAHNLECHDEQENESERKLLKKCFSVELSTCELVIILQSIFLIPLVFLRWMTPYSARLDRSAHSTLVILLLSSAADLVDFVEYINIEPIVEYFHGLNEIMIPTTCSSIIFCFTLTATKKIKRVETGLWYWIDFLFGTEAWAVLLVALLLDIPYLIVRSWIISKHGLFVHPTIAFFFFKNILMILAAFYRLVSLRKEYIETMKKFKEEGALGKAKTIIKFNHDEQYEMKTRL